ncbi:MAG: gamma-glutamyl-gamma-aminobutyrate hydrolase family protein [Lachnospiraceae bacterium]|nr:gamma-glutamyl-gamma-aminobutyrate hydrolase family protein [Lachnospiraceae bacterium]
MALKSVPAGLTVEAYSEDGVIEAVKAKDKEIYGTMWHRDVRIHTQKQIFNL